MHNSIYRCAYYVLLMSSDTDQELAKIVEAIPRGLEALSAELKPIKKAQEAIELLELLSKSRNDSLLADATLTLKHCLQKHVSSLKAA